MDFYDWLIAQGKSPKTATNYSGPISGRLAAHAGVIRAIDFDHEQLKSDTHFKSYCAEHDHTGELYALNKRGKDMYRRALIMYAEYVSATNSQQGPIGNFEEQVTVAKRDSQFNRRKRLKLSPKIPPKSSTVVDVFDRNPDVVAEVLFRANGICESCSGPAPFIRKSDNTPYLEVHHRLPLAKGGDDTVENAEALCPNCHREKHYGI